ncbi:3,4-dihydroxy-2-butanone-4-phosphate synthase [Orrella dioscoreae]|uniref:3,4-dihydroxy-2-butanone 4-phosphate synthase n=2 Tax=root TaxID=1 RepID=A0A1C3K6I0_9BURK|nr:3,4-dihydroxy-2-butanone-4-phosphate synthase [Orrella dioscoreae]SBT27093.1 3,4-dihydroxy-2-butanone 4-phosphate synthase [Orrella dioscoreae]SOE45911.1 3,4-dihydroxy-2-butanone 4-phosphate synthase [Orrella dioscoreae]
MSAVCFPDVSPTATAVPPNAVATLDARPFAARLARALHDLRIGRPVILLDDFDRENEADLIVAAAKLTVPVMAQLIRDGSGIVCLCLTDETVAQLDLPPMVARNDSRHGTGFTVSIEARAGVSTGVSAADRVTTIRTAIAPQARPEDLARPGHVFPLRAQPGGVLARRGHTEGSIELAELAGLGSSAVLCELMNPDGTMMRGEALDRYAARQGLVALTIAELVAHREALDAQAEAGADSAALAWGA